MSASAAQVRRMLALVPFLQAHEGIPVDRVAAEFGVAPKVIHSDLQRLMMTGIGEHHGELIDVDLGALDHDGIVFLRDADFMTRPLRVDAREAAALIVALRTLRESADADGAAVIDSALGKLEIAAGQAIDAPVDVVLEPVSAAVERAVQAAVTSQRRLRLVYAGAARDTQTERDISVRRRIARGGFHYLEAWCHRAEDVRYFRLDRMIEARVTEVPATLSPADPAAGSSPRTELSSELFTPGPDTPWVVLLVEPSAAWIVDHYATELLTPDHDQDVMRVRLYGGDRAWLTRLILGLGGAVQIVEPLEMVEQVREAAVLALAAYDENEPTT